MLHLLLAAGEGIGGDSGTGLGNLPADSARAWGVIITVFAMAVCPIIAARMSTKKAISEAAKPSPPIVAIGASVTPHIDVSQQLLVTMVAKLEARVDAADSRYIELETKHYALMREYAKAEAEVDSLRAQISILHVRLTGSS